MAKRYELSDEAWILVADLFTSTHTRGRPRSSDRLMLDGVLWLLRSGAPWRDMPECFGPWRTVYHRFRLWRNRGTFEQMLKRLHLKLNDQGLIDLQTWMIDSTAVRATRASSGAGKKGGLMNPQITLEAAVGAVSLPRFICSATPMACLYASCFLAVKPAISATQSHCWTMSVSRPASAAGLASVAAGFWPTRATMLMHYAATVTGIACSRSFLCVR